MIKSFAISTSRCSLVVDLNFRTSQNADLKLTINRGSLVQIADLQLSIFSHLSVHIGDLNLTHSTY